MIVLWVSVNYHFVESLINIPIENENQDNIIIKVEEILIKIDELFAMYNIIITNNKINKKSYKKDSIVRFKDFVGTLI